MKFKAMLLGLSVMTALPAFAQKPVYLDTGKPIEERVKDALNRMTLEEKVKMIHARLNLVRQVFPASESPKYGLPTVLTVSVRKSYGMNGIRQDGQTIPVLPIRH